MAELCFMKREQIGFLGEWPIFGRMNRKSLMVAPDSEKSRLDEAARAGWLYFIAGHTQDEIAKMLQISRASAQRLVSLCLAERLITFRLEHPIATCMELAARLKDLFHLVYCEVVPTDPAAPLAAAGIAERAANILESMLRTEKPTIVALGTGRAVRAAVERVSPIDRPNHQIVSLVGNISADGSASFFDTVGRLADRTKARHYPMPLPFLMASAAERDQMLKIDPIARVRAVAAKADLRLVGIGQMDQLAQVHVDGFVSREELFEMMRLGAVGELTGWAFDAQGRIIVGGINARITSIPPQVPAEALTIGAAVGPAKVSAIRAALQGRLINGLVTDETTASAILKQ
jgi:DNA-binding transcriptional regulator LsrR (DeoR family)